MPQDTGQTVICRRCEKYRPPSDIVDGTLDSNRTGVCTTCDSGIVVTADDTWTPDRR
jgi:hypothetical protein